MATTQHNLVFSLCSQCRGRGEFLFYSYQVANFWKPTKALDIMACPCITLANDIRRAQFECDKLSRAAGGELKEATEKLEALRTQYRLLIHGGE